MWRLRSDSPKFRGVRKHHSHRKGKRCVTTSRVIFFQEDATLIRVFIAFALHGKNTIGCQAWEGGRERNCDDEVDTAKDAPPFPAITCNARLMTMCRREYSRARREGKHRQCPRVNSRPVVSDEDDVVSEREPIGDAPWSTARAYLRSTRSLRETKVSSVFSACSRSLLSSIVSLQPRERRTGTRKGKKKSVMWRGRIRKREFERSELRRGKEYKPRLTTGSRGSIGKTVDRANTWDKKEKKRNEKYPCLFFSPLGLHHPTAN